MDKDIKSEESAPGEILSLSLSAEVSKYISTMNDQSLVRLSPVSISNIEGSAKNLTHNNIDKTVVCGGHLSGDLMFGVAQPHGKPYPYLLLFHKENNGKYAYDLYPLSSLEVGDFVVQCRHLASDLRSGHSRYLAGTQYITGRNAMPANVPVEISSMTPPVYTSDFSEYLSSAISTVNSKLS